MALDKATLITSLTAAFADVTAGKTAAQAATQVADAIDVYVKSGTVAFTAGQITGNDSGGDTHAGLVASGGAIS